MKIFCGKPVYSYLRIENKYNNRYEKVFILNAVCSDGGADGGIMCW